MNGDDMSGETNSGDDFWGGTPDWTDAPARPRREKRSGGKRSGDVTGAIKGLWASAMTAGADATREHRVIDAATPPPKADAVGPNMFDDIDDDFRFDTGSVADHTFDQSEASTTNPTGEVPILDVFDEATLAVVAPVSMSERQDDRRRSGAIDPLLVRLGAVAIATTLLVPLAIGLSAGADDSDTLTSASASASASAEAATAAPTFDTAPATDASGPVADSAAATPAGLDPDSLPPAVPVDQGSTSTSASSGDSSADDDTSGDLAVESAASELDGSTDSSDSNGSLSTSDAMQADAATDATADGVDEAASADDGAERVTNCAIDYTVVGGDFWLRLAAAADVSLAELLEANGASVNTPLYPGSEICLPAGATTPAPPAAETDATTPASPATPTTAAPTTTTAPTTAPPTTAAPTTTAAPDSTPNTDATPEEVKQIIRDVWPDELEGKALEIAFRESRYAPTAKNYCCYGLFQIYWSVHQSWLAGIGITDDQQLYDPATNARAAYALYERAGGWGPWSQTNY